MPSGFWLGVLASVGAVATVVLGLIAIYYASLGLAALWGRYAPSHWWLSGPMRHARPAHEVFRRTNANGGYASTLRRWVRVGPWAVYVVRYRAGADPAKEARELIP